VVWYQRWLTWGGGCYEEYDRNGEIHGLLNTCADENQTCKGRQNQAILLTENSAHSSKDSHCVERRDMLSGETQLLRLLDFWADVNVFMAFTVEGEGWKI